MPSGGAAEAAGEAFSCGSSTLIDHGATDRARARPTCDAVRLGAPCSFAETPLAGAVRRRARTARRRAGLLRPHVLRARVRRPRPAHALPAVQPVAQPRGPARCAGCTTTPPPHGEAKLVRCAAARSTTSSSTCAPARRRGSRWFGVELTAGGRQRAVRPGGLRPRVPDPRATTPTSTTRWASSTSPTRRAGCAGTTPRSASTGRAPPAVISERDATYPDFDLATFDG